ncbi:ATP-binding cassette domain-containing protein [Shewanella sp. 3B26]|uniref:ATP-binding cassette domain-containing protein n=1 Tax=Shewanella zhuhaiensis TaxID=2919576 RepID=A0AAJ1BJL3_9GAMM|nr:ATP-binding cassette domain-containing protein [Shewanella zhuhaiensis]MCH4295995.1 ATP-binding cassette domain-containing protein [Shewanella zhuhaiensis]
MIHIRANRLEKSYSTVKAVDGVSLQVEGGQILALLGPNGAGKSSLIRMLVGLTRPDNGELVISQGGKPLSRLPREDYGYLPEDRGLYQDRTVTQNLNYIGELRGLPKARIDSQIALWTERFGLAEKRGDKLSQLSKGNQQKVQLIACLLHEPELLILDEPFSGLDPVNQELVVSVLAELRAAGKSIVLSAHQMALVERLADRMLLINHGKPVASGSLAEVMAQLSPGDGYQVALNPVPELADLQALSTVDTAIAAEGHWSLTKTRDASLQQFLNDLAALGELVSFAPVQPNLHELYLRAVGGNNREVEEAV